MVPALIAALLLQQPVPYGPAPARPSATPARAAPYGSAPYRPGAIYGPARPRGAPVQGARPHRARPAYRAAPTAMAPIPDPLTSGGYRLAPGASSSGYASGERLPTPVLAATGVTIDAYDPRIEGPFATPDRSYELAVLGGASAAQGSRGALDGGWSLASAEGAPLFALQLVDEGDGSVVEGAWRDLAADARLHRSGFLSLVGRGIGETIITFYEPGAGGATTARLTPALDGTWRGELARGGEPGDPIAVVMRRR